MINNNGNNNVMWKSIADDYFEMLGKIDENKYIAKIHKYEFYFGYVNKIRELFSFTYFQSLLTSFGKEKYKPTIYKVNYGYTMLVDGSIYYGKLYREQTEDLIEGDINKTIQSPHLLDNFNELSNKNKEILYAFIIYLRK